MAAKLPDGSTVFIANTYSASKAITAITNTVNPVASVVAHGLANGDFVEITSGWGGVNGRVFMVENVTADTFKIMGVDTTLLTKYPTGAGKGSFRKVASQVQILQILDFSTSGGEQQFTDFSYLEEDFARQLPTITSAQSVTVGIADDPSLPGYQALKAASDARTQTALFLKMRDGSVIAYNTIVSLNETPTTTKGQVMQVNATFSLQGRPVRY